MMAGRVKSLLQFILPKGKPNPIGTSYTGTFLPGSTNTALPIPQYQDHLQDLFTLRTADDSRTLLKLLFKQDPDVSAAVNSYLTMADVTPYWIVRDSNGVINRDAHKFLEQMMKSLFGRTDYTTPQPFYLTKSIRAVCEEMRYAILLRGGVGGELVLNKLLQPSEIRMVDLATVEWTETAPGVYIPNQRPVGSGKLISMNIPTFNVQFYRRDPFDIYPYSPFVSAINTIAARQQVINDLYRIMKITGYPKMALKVVEETLRKNAPADAKADENKMQIWLKARMQEISTSLASMTPDQAFVHFDSVEPGMVNEKTPGMQVNITSVIETLNSQNQAALKVMATVIGRGNAGVNTASVEARLFALSAEQVNKPIADFMSQQLTLALQMNGIDGTVEFGFDNVEMRPMLELEAQLTMKQTRWLTLLSLGVIDDDTFHIEFFNRIRPDAAPILSGTGFAPLAGAVDVSKVSPNSDPLGRSLTPADSAPARSN